MKRETDPAGFAPRYVDLPERHQAVRAGRRNLFWGVALLFAALVLLGLATFIGGGRAMLWPVASLITFTILWVLARLRVFRQRNGIFLGIAFVALIGSMLALCERGFSSLAASRAAGRAEVPTVSVGASPSAAQVPEVPLLTEALNLPPPDPAEGSRVKILKESEVTIGRRNYRVLAGDTFPFEEASGGEVTFAAGEFLAKIPATAVQILGPQRVQPGGGRPASGVGTDELAPAATADPASIEIERRARAEAIRRFPALGIKNSPENREFVRTYNELKRKQSAMLEDPEWPIRLAEILAKDSGWREAEEREPEAAPEPPPDAAPQPPQEP